MWIVEIQSSLYKKVQVFKNELYHIAIIINMILLTICCTTEVIAQKPRSMEVGGPCKYKQYTGKATIVSVVKKTCPKNDHMPRKVCFEMKFTFSSEEEIQENFAHVEGREHTVLLKNTSCLEEKIPGKYGIEKGKELHCVMNVIVKGSCTPVIFDFPAIDLKNYLD